MIDRRHYSHMTNAVVRQVAGPKIFSPECRLASAPFDRSSGGQRSLNDPEHWRQRAGVMCTLAEDMRDGESKLRIVDN